MGAGTDRRTPIRQLLASARPGERVSATGWIKTTPSSKNVRFLHLMDGSTPRTLQVVVPAGLVSDEVDRKLAIGAAVRVAGAWVPSVGSEQAFEVLADAIEVVGESDAGSYPIQRKRTSLEHLRTIAHLRPRTNTFQSMYRVRNALAWQIHRFFQERGFLWVHTPILTSSDAEGAGELFAISTSDGPAAFFGRPTFLTVSGQLEAECVAQSHTDVYTFGPTFRAENSNTPRHAAEFWMIEPEIAFADLADVMSLAEDFVRQIARETLAQCPEDFAFFDERVSPGVLASVSAAIERPFARVTYTEAQEILHKSGKTFEFPIGWGTSLQAEHERFLAEEHFRGPVFVTDYPKAQKAFYMRMNADERTVAATDLLVPRLGEIIGGSQREERHDRLVSRMKELSLHTEGMWWYLELRRWGSTPHGGFGLGFERMLMWLTGIANIRDAIPFPRTPGNADF
jgi:asparaginyl-tRNA synthetase